MNRRDSYQEMRAQIEDCNPEAIFFDNPSYESALIGMTHDGRAVYDQNLCIEYLIEQDEDPDPEHAWEHAADFFSYNTLRALDYIDAKNRPVIVDALVPSHS
jgi:hypothetical protein